MFGMFRGWRGEGGEGGEGGDDGDGGDMSERERRFYEQEMELERRFYEEQKERRIREQKEREEKEKKHQKTTLARVEMHEKLDRVKNNNAGLGYKVCDMQRLKRFLILGSEFNNFYCVPKQIILETVQCAQNLIKDNHYQEVLDTIMQYAKEGRAPKDEPLLVVLAICAVHERMEVRKAAYDRVNSICSIPTQLFKFIDLTHSEIVRRRIANPPEPQLCISKKQKKRKHQHSDPEPIHAEKKEPSENVDDQHGDPEPSISDLTIHEEKKEPSENVDETQVPTKKKKRMKQEFKKVNTKAIKSLGWGRMRRKGIGNFYLDDQKDACRLLYLLTKYKQRHSWSHTRVLQCAHPKMSGEDRDAKNLVLTYCTHGYARVADEMEKLGSMAGLSEKISEVIAYINAINSVAILKPDVDGDEEKLIKILEDYGRRQQDKEFTSQHSFDENTPKENKFGRKSPIQIVREHLPTGFLNSRKVWELMLLDMPMTAMIRNLGKMSSLQMFEDDNSQNTKLVVSALSNEKRLQSARVHPVKLLIAIETYVKGRPIAAQTYRSRGKEDGGLSWPVNREIVKALNGAFYKSFRSPEFGKTFKTNKKYLLGLDVSGSMQGAGCLGCPSLTPATATAAMAMVTWNIEDDVEIMGFGGYFEDLKHMLDKSMTVREAMNKISSLNFGATDCALPMIWALGERKEIDVFIVYTDCETSYQSLEPMDALRLYNLEMNRDAKLIVCAMTSGGFTIADPADPVHALDIIGFDANVPEIINQFVTGDKNMQCTVCNECKSASQQE